MSLDDAPLNQKLKVININSCVEARRKLSQMGIHTDDILVKIIDNKWGPILVEHISLTSKLALGRGLAEKILVAYES